MLISHHIKTVIDAAQSLGYDVENLDSFSSQVVRISNNMRSVIIGAGDICSFPTNKAGAVELVKDKSHTINLLRHFGFNTPEGDYFFTSENYRKFRGDGKEVCDALSYAQTIGFPVFVKPNDGSRGAFVELIFTREQLEAYIERVKHTCLCIRIEKPLRGHESRLFVVKGQIWFGYQRRGPELQGDGKHTVRDLLAEQIQAQRALGKASLTEESPFLILQLQQRELTLDSVLPERARLPFTPAQNLAIGGAVQNYRESFSEALQAWAQRIYQIFGLDVFGIDVYSEADALSVDNLTILEINGNPSMESADKHSQNNVVHKVWQQQFDAMLGLAE